MKLMESVLAARCKIISAPTKSGLHSPWLARQNEFL